MRTTHQVYWCSLKGISGSHPAYEALELCTLHGPRCFGVCKLPDDKLGCPVLLPKFREQILQCCPQVWQQGTAHLGKEHAGLNVHWIMGIYLPLLPIFNNAIGLIYAQTASMFNYSILWKKAIFNEVFECSHIYR